MISVVLGDGSLVRENEERQRIPIYIRAFVCFPVFESEIELRRLARKLEQANNQDLWIQTFLREKI